jgi:RecJ-like exonuclease
MLSVELARMIEPDLTEDLRHVPAVAGLADRSAADEMADYLTLAEEAGYEEADLQAVADALDYAAHWLRYGPGRGVTDDLLGTGDPDRHEELIDLFASRARRDIERQLDAALPHVESGELESGVTYHTLDVEHHAHRFTYPAPGTTTGAIHDRKVSESDEPTITIGYGPDFAVLRSDGVRLDIPRMVTDLNEAFAGGGVSGGGHLVVGSIRFVKGMREEILDALIEEMGDAEIDETLGATAPRTYASAASGDAE